MALNGYIDSQRVDKNSRSQPLVIGQSCGGREISFVLITYMYVDPVFRYPLNAQSRILKAHNHKQQIH